jgi:hypothetical protein
MAVVARQYKSDRLNCVLAFWSKERHIIEKAGHNDTAMAGRDAGVTFVDDSNTMFAR